MLLNFSHLCTPANISPKIFVAFSGSFFLLVGQKLKNELKK